VRAVNLIPSDQRSSGSVATRSGGAAYFVLVLVGGVAALAWLYGSARHTVSAQRGQVAALNAQTQEVQAQVARLSPYTSFIALREQRVQAVAQLVGSRFDWPAAMGELSRVLPGNVALTSVNGTIASGAPGSTGAPAAAPPPAAGASKTSGAVSSATPPGATPSFTVVGCATSQSTVAQVLVRLRLIAGVKSVELQSSTKPTGGSGASSSGSSATTGGCSAGDPVFTAQVDFEPLPSAPALVDTPHTAATSEASR